MPRWLHICIFALPSALPNCGIPQCTDAIVLGVPDIYVSILVFVPVCWFGIQLCGAVPNFLGRYPGLLDGTAKTWLSVLHSGASLYASYAVICLYMPLGMSALSIYPVLTSRLFLRVGMVLADL